MILWYTLKIKPRENTMITDMFRNPVGLAAARRCNSGAMGAWADEIWDSICFIGCDGNPFHTSDVARLVHNNAEGAITLNTAQKYVFAFIAYAKAVPEDFR